MYSVIVIIKKKEKKNRRETENISLELTWPTENRTQAQIVRPVDKQCPIHTATETKGPSGTVTSVHTAFETNRPTTPRRGISHPHARRRPGRACSLLNSRRFTRRPQHLLRRPPHRDPDSGAARRCSGEPTSLPG